MNLLLSKDLKASHKYEACPTPGCNIRYAMRWLAQISKVNN